MIISTKGFLLNYLKYNDNSLIIELYTHARGKESFIISVKKFPRNYFKILSSYDLEIIIRENRNIQKIKSLSLLYNYDFYFNTIKSCIIIFLADFLIKILPKNQPDDNLYYFIENSIYEFNKISEGIANFHLSFILKLTKYLGISIENYLLSKENNLLVDKNLVDLLLNLYKIDYYSLDEIKLNKNIRNRIMQIILNFYSINYNNITNLKSIDILKEIFD